MSDIPDFVKKYSNDYPSKVQNIYFCWLDILGFKSLLKEEPEKLYGSLKMALELAEIFSFSDKSDPISLIKEHSKIPKVLHYKFNVLKNIEVFSDSIMIKVYDNEAENILKVSTFFSIIQKIFLHLITNNIYIRGAIVYNTHVEEILDKKIEGKITISNALVEAYSLESKEAKYARIIIGKSFLKKIDGIPLTNLINYNQLLKDLNDNLIVLNTFKSFNKEDPFIIKKIKEESTKYTSEIYLKYKYMLDMIDFNNNNFTNHPDSMFKFKKLTYDDICSNDYA